MYWHFKLSGSVKCIECGIIWYTGVKWQHTEIISNNLTCICSIIKSWSIIRNKPLLWYFCISISYIMPTCTAYVWGWAIHRDLNCVWQHTLYAITDTHWGNQNGLGWGRADFNKLEVWFTVRTATKKKNKIPLLLRKPSTLDNMDPNSQMLNLSANTEIYKKEKQEALNIYQTLCELQTFLCQVCI